MKVLALSGSPHGEKGCTSHILKNLLEGMQEAGAQTELLELAKYKINHCLGCFICWVKTPGKCVHKDGMSGLLEKYAAADILVFGTPLYHFNMTGLLKDFIDRTLPIAEPWFVSNPDNPGLSSHPSRYQKTRSILLVSPAGFPEKENFQPLVNWFKEYAQIEGSKYLGEILAAGMPIIMYHKEFKDIMRDFDLAVRQAGKQLILTGAISADLKDRLNRDLFPDGPEAFRKYGNENWQKMIDKLKT
ncbi:MAG: flavodoxin family protein [Candidatus Omnitrophica bacterium]|nr:flavodoxin family protein [Candidatus Omnitrophota bacterium]